MHLPRLDHRNRAIKRRQSDIDRAGTFFPTQLGEVTAWLRNTASSGSISSLTDVLNSNPATQGTAASQPTGALSSNSLPVISFDGTDDFLLWSVHPSNNSSPRWGYAAWIRPSTVSGVHTIYACRGLTGASATRLEIQQNNTDVFVNIAHSNVSIRRGTASGVLALNTWLFLTVEFDGDQSAETDECIITANNVKQTLTFVDDTGTPGDMPNVLVQPTGTGAIGDLRVASPLQPWQGLIGTNQWILQGAGGISGGGLITSTQRNNLMIFEQPT